MTNGLKLTIVLNADGTALTGTLRVAEGQVKAFGASLDGSGKAAERATQSKKRLNAEIDKTSKKSRSLVGELGGLRAAFSVLGVSFVAREILGAGLAIDRFERGLTAAMGSQRAAASEMAFVRAEATRIGIALQDVTTGYVLIANAAKGTALAGQPVREMFLGVIETSRVFNLTQEQVMGTLNAMSQMISKGTISMEELRQQLGDRMPGALQTAARSMNMTTAELIQLVSQGKVAAEDFLPAFAKGLRDAAAAGLVMAQNSPAAEFARMRGAWFELAGAIANGGVLSELASAATSLAKSMMVLVNSGAAQAVGAAMGFIIRNADALVLILGVRLVAAMAATRSITIAASAENMRYQLTLMRMAGAGGVAAAALTALGTAGKAAMGLLGGPIGVAVIALYSLHSALTGASERAKQLHDDAQAGAKASAAMAVEARELATALGEGVNFELAKQATVQLEQMQVQLAANKTQLDELNAAANPSIWRQLGVSMQYGQLGAMALRVEKEHLTAQSVELTAANADLQRGVNTLSIAMASQLVPAAQTAVTEFVRIAAASIAAKKGFSEFPALFANLLAQVNSMQGAGAKFQAFTNGLGKQHEALAKSISEHGKSAGDLIRANAKLAAQAGELAGIGKDEISSMLGQAAAAAALADQLDALKKKKTGLSEAEKLAKNAAKDYMTALKTAGAAQKDFLKLQVELSTEMGGASVEAAERYANRLAVIAQWESQMLQLGPQSTAALQALTDARNAAAASRDRDILLAQYELSAMQEFEQGLQQEITALGLTNEQREISNTLRAAEQALLRSGVSPLSAEGVAYLNNAQAMTEYLQVKRKAIEQTRVFQDIVYQGFNSAADAVGAFATGGIKSIKDFGKALVDIVRRSVADMIAEFLKMKVIESFLNGLFGTGTGSGGSFDFGQMLRNFFGGGSGAQSSGAGLYNNAGSYIGAGSLLYGGATAAGTGAAYAGMGSLAYGATAAAPTYAGAAGFQSITSGYLGTTGASTGATTAGGGGGAGGAMAMVWVAAIVAGMMASAKFFKEGWRASDGDFGGGFAGLAGRAGAFGDKPLTALGMSEQTAAILTGSALHTRVWGRQAPMAERQNFGLNLSESGGTASVNNDMIRRGGWLRSSRRWNEEGEASADAQNMAQAFFSDLQIAMKEIARVMGADLVPMLEANLRTIVEYDKKGKETGRKFFVDVMGRSWEEASEELARKRITAEALIKQLGEPASLLAEQWRDDAQSLMIGAQVLLAASVDIKKGFQLVADGTLETTIGFVQSLAAAGETLDATYSRVSQSTALFDDALALMGVALNKTREDVVTLAVQITEAAGGIERANQLWTTFRNNFFTPEELAAVQSQQLDSSLRTEAADVGLDPYTSAEQFKQLFMAALPTLTAAEIVQWLEFGEAIAAVNNHIGAARADYANFAAGILNANIMSALSPFGRSMVELTLKYRQQTAEANRLARAAGLAAAGSDVLTGILGQFTAAAAEAMAQLRESALDLISQLYGGGADSIAQSAQTFADSATQSAGAIAAAIADLNAFADGLRVGDLSPNNQQQQLDDVRRMLLQASGAGDVEAVKRLAQQTLQVGRGLFATGSDYRELFDWVDNVIRSTVPVIASDGSTGGTSEAAAAILTPMQRAQMAREVAQMVADASQASGLSVAEVAADWNLNLDLLASDLGISLEDVGGYIEGLKVNFDNVATRIDANAQSIVAALTGGPGSVVESIHWLPGAIVEGLKPILSEQPIDVIDPIAPIGPLGAVPPPNGTLLPPGTLPIDTDPRDGEQVRILIDIQTALNRLGEITAAQAAREIDREATEGMALNGLVLEFRGLASRLDRQIK